MAEKSSGTDQSVSAWKLLKTAKTAAELRTAQAVLFPLELSMSQEQTAKVISHSVRWTCSQRTRYRRIALARGEEKAPRTKWALHKRAIATLEQEAQILGKVWEGSAQGCVVVIPSLKEKLEERLGERLALSTIYQMLWHAMAGVTLCQILITLREMLRCAMIGKKERLDEMIAT